MSISKLLDLVKEQHPNLNGISMPPGKQPPFEQGDPKLLILHFEDGASKAEKQSARALVDSLDLNNFPGAYIDKRAKEYRELDMKDQNDAILKGVNSLINLLIDKRIATVQELDALNLIPDKDKPIDTPAGLLGRIADIKVRFPKE